jgi:hypothetical protein
LPTTISLTPRFRQKREVWLRFFAENDQNDPKTYSYEDSAKFNVTFLVITLSHASRFRRKRGVIKNFEYLCANFKNVFENVGCTAFCIY